MVSWVERAGFEGEDACGVWGLGGFCGEKGREVLGGFGGLKDLREW